MVLVQHVEAVIRDIRPLDADHDHLADLLRRRHRVDNRIDLLVECLLLRCLTCAIAALRLAAARRDCGSRQSK